jgi:hypothetical protein
MSLLGSVELLALGLWLGADLLFSFVVAPGAFSLLPSRDQAGAVVGYTLGRMHFLGMALGVAALLARAARMRKLGGLLGPPGVAMALMTALTALSQFVVTPRMADLRREMGSIEAAPPGSALLVEFGRLHRISVSLEGAVLLAGVIGFFLLARELSRPVSG